MAVTGSKLACMFRAPEDAWTNLLVLGSRAQGLAWKVHVSLCSVQAEPHRRCRVDICFCPSSLALKPQPCIPSSARGHSELNASSKSKASRVAAAAMNNSQFFEARLERRDAEMRLHSASAAAFIIPVSISFFVSI